MNSVLSLTRNQFVRFLLLSAFILTFFLSSSAFCHEGMEAEKSFQSHACIAEKVYVEYSNLLIDEEGIFFCDAEGGHPVDEIGCDADGFYIYAKDNEAVIKPKVDPTCINGHPIFHKECGGCAHWWCSCRCKCYSPLVKK